MAMGPYDEVLSDIAQFRARRSKPSSEPPELVTYEQQVWESFELEGILDHTRLLEECQMRVQMGEEDAKQILEKLHQMHEFRHKPERRAHRWELLWNHPRWLNLEEVEPDRRQRASVGRRMWVLLIGNEKYAQYPLEGAVDDCKAWESYLVDFLGVPEEHITFLMDADRKTMLNALYDLRDNKSIKRDDHILFVYSGQAQSYGAKTFSLEEDSTHRAGSIEALCPIDRSPPSRDGKIQVPDISDRELLLILADIHEWTNANITVFLDCDYSGGFSKAEVQVDVDSATRARGRNMYNVHEMLVAADYHPHRNPRRNPSSLSAYSPTWAIDTVDLYRPAILAACQDTELAWEGYGHGLFTSAVLKVLRSEVGKEITCSELIEFVSPLRHDQKPRFDGEDRVLFGANRRG